MFVLLVNGKRKQFPTLFAAVYAASEKHPHLNIIWEWDGPTSGHFDLHETVHGYRLGRKAFGVIREV